MRVFRIGLTPAYAGNIQLQEKLHIHTGAHPRIRGEYDDAVVHVPDIEGSPPHTRGIFPPDHGV